MNQLGDEIIEIDISEEVKDLLDIVKKFNPTASYNETIYFLIGQYSKQLENANNKLMKKQLVMDDEVGTDE